MGEDQSAGGTQMTASRDGNGASHDTVELREQIEQSRRQLGETVEALAYKTDVKARAEDKLDDVKHTLGEKKDATVRQLHEARSRAAEITPDAAATAATQASEQVRANPLPAAVIAAFVAGYVIAKLRSR